MSVNLYNLYILPCKCQATGLLEDCFEKLPWKKDSESWPEACLRGTMLYLRRSKRVRLPFQFKSMIPRDEVEANLFLD